MPRVRHSHLVLVALLVTTSTALRETAHGGTSAEDLGAKEFRVFAATFNAGNEVYDGSQRFADLAEILLDGHEQQGDVADIVFLGFQEFRDTKYKMGNFMRETKLWQRLGSSTMAAFKTEVEEATTAPAGVHAAKAALERALEDFRNTMSSELAQLLADDGEEAKDSSSNLTATSTVKGRLAPIHTWTQAALQRLEELKGRYPNLAYSDAGDDLWKSYEGKVDNAKRVETLLLQSLESMSKELDAWRNQSRDLVRRLVQPAEFGVRHGHVEVGMHPQKFDAGKRCAVGNHYDTFIYAYVNPFSKWKITVDPFSSDACAERTAGSQVNPGCNIDNNVGKECGKVVNLMRFKAEQGDTLLTICGLNTHMSFAGDTTARMKYIAQAMQEAEVAKCDSVFFLGDFNSRLHCEEGPQQTLPPFERMGESGRSSLDYILNKFCTDGNREETCQLKDSRLDELNQMLTQDVLECYEKYSKPKPGSIFGTLDFWDIFPTPNPVFDTGLREVAHPAWPPTYKLKRKDKIKHKSGVWSRCFEGQPMCFMNKNKEGKHNPAWTDRILMKSSSSAVRLVPKVYGRRPAPFLSSDHSPVTAAVTVRVTS